MDYLLYCNLTITVITIITMKKLYLLFFYMKTIHYCEQTQVKLGLLLGPP